MAKRYTVKEISEKVPTLRIGIQDSPITFDIDLKTSELIKINFIGEKEKKATKCSLYAITMQITSLFRALGDLMFHYSFIKLNRTPMEYFLELMQEEGTLDK